MIKICHITSVHNINDIRIFEKECVSLAKHGYDVTLIACGDTAFCDKKKGVKRISLKVPVKNRLQRFIKRTTKVFYKALEVDAEIYHLHDPELLPIGIKLKRRGKKVIFDSHEFYGEQIKEKTYIPKIFRYLLAKTYKLYETYVTTKIDAVIQICTIQGKNYFSNRAKINAFISNSSILKNNTPNNITFKERKSIAYIGALSHNRGITHLVKAANIANAKLILSGQFVSIEYRKTIESLPEYKNVEYTGFLSQENVATLLNTCFVGISTLLHLSQYNKIDTFPSKVYDYMAAGIPVIISNTEYAKKMIHKYQFGICVTPDNIDEISEAIIYLQKNPKKATEMGKNARAAYEKEFNWSIEEKKLVELYKELQPTR